MKLGAFSISLSVKDINKSKIFYENIGFIAFGGDIENGWIIMKNDSTVIGLFEGMFKKNMLTFNPGWDGNAKNLDSFMDIRELQKELKVKGVKLLTEADETSEGPATASFTIEDPDGNPILIDQHR